MRTFIILFLLGFFVSCASNQNKPLTKEEPIIPHTDYPGFYQWFLNTFVFLIGILLDYIWMSLLLVE